MNYTVTYVDISDIERTVPHEDVTFYIDEQGNLLITDNQGNQAAAYSRHSWRIIN